jgi:hypothetical protein
MKHAIRRIRVRWRGRDTEWVASTGGRERSQERKRLEVLQSLLRHRTRHDLGVGDRGHYPKWIARILMRVSAERNLHGSKYGAASVYTLSFSESTYIAALNAVHTGANAEDTSTP